MKKGYYGIGIYETKEETNVGTLWRSAQNFGADFIFTIGARYKTQKYVNGAKFNLMELRRQVASVILPAQQSTV